MKIKFLILVMFFAACSLATCSIDKGDKTASDPHLSSIQSSGETGENQLVKRGEYLVEVMLCNDCHTPKMMTPSGPVPDPSRLLSGHQATEQLANVNDPQILNSYALFNLNFTATIGPWGTSFAGNLTPDVTGLGNWTYEHFETALRKGKYKGLEAGRDLLPPMPWMSFSKLNDEDMRAIWAYLQSIPPIQNLVPAAVPPLS